MVLNILKKKKRATDVQLLFNTGKTGGYFRQSNFQGESTEKNHQKTYDYPSLTWDTLKRKRRQNRESKTGESSFVDERLNKARKNCERFRSSPDLFQNTFLPKIAGTNIAPKKLNQTNCATTGSLITLNFLSQEDKIIKETAYEDVEKDDDYDTLAHDDSGCYCDSDSGVSSLYDTINKLHGDTCLQDSDRDCQEYDKCSQKLNITFLRNLDQSLVDIFTRDYKRTVTSEKFSMTLDISSKLSSSPKMFLDSCCKKHLTMLVIARQKELNTDSSILRQELKIIDNKLSDLEEELKLVVTVAELTIFRRTVDQISAIVNLVFGLELRLSEGRDNSRRLSEATSIKERHDNSLHKTGWIVRERLGVSRMIIYRTLVKNKQRILATIKCFKMELYYVQTLMNLVSSLF